MKHILQHTFRTSPRARALDHTASSWPETCYTAGPHAKLESCAEIPTHSARPKPQTATYRIACHTQQHSTLFARHREPVRSTGRPPHGWRLATQLTHMLHSSSAPKSPHTPRAPSLRLPLAKWHAIIGLQHTHCTCQKKHTSDASNKVK